MWTSERRDLFLLRELTHEGIPFYRHELPILNMPAAALCALQGEGVDGRLQFTEDASGVRRYVYVCVRARCACHPVCAGSQPSRPARTRA